MAEAARAGSLLEAWISLLSRHRISRDSFHGSRREIVKER
jgi:hypothetical protein